MMKEKNLTVTDIKEETNDVKISIEGEAPKKPKAPPTKLQILRSKLTNKTFVVLSLMGVIGLSVFFWLLYTLLSFHPPTSTTLSKFTDSYIEPNGIISSEIKQFGIVEPSEPRTKSNPLNGSLLTNSEFQEYSERRPVAVMINNHSAARPTSNLQKADIVYETLVESGITRHMAVYWQNAVSKVGPIRSARQPYLEWLSEYDAIYIHDGYASDDDPRVDAGGNIWRYGIHSISTEGSWRDSTRVAPHNEYSSVAYALGIGAENEWTGLPSDFSPWKFKNDSISDERGDMKGVEVNFHSRLSNGGAYNVSWSYDKNTNTYVRSVGNSLDLDFETGEALRAKSVIIQLTDIVPSGNEKAHVITTTIGEGDAVIIQDGNVIEGKWKKPSRTDRTKYYNNDDRELLFNRGLIWMQIISTDDSSFAIIEQ